MICDTFICTVLFGLLESPKITLFNDLFMGIIKVKVTENGIYFALFRDFKLNYPQKKIPK